jgi:predicted ATP-grasp superfamily ATP-dependent carboligase
MPRGDDLLMKVLITDGHQRSALAVTRSLGRAGMDVYVGEAERKNLAASSKYCRQAVVYRSPFNDEKGFVDTIRQVISAEHIDLVIPISDITSSILSEHKKVLEQNTTVAVVDYQPFWTAADKNCLHHIAEELGVPTPTIVYVDRPEQLSEKSGKIPFPCVVKPSRSRLRLGGVWRRTSVLRVQSKEELLELIQKSPELQQPFMIQREIRGEGCGIFALCEKGDAKVLFSHRRLREKPPWGGVSTLRESVALDPTMKEHALRLLRRLEWHGVAMVEFKREAGTGVLYLMEINGRFWGSLQLAIDAGIDFPVLLVQMFRGNGIHPRQDYRVGIRSRWLLGDVDHLLARLLRRGRDEMSAPSLGSLVWDFARVYRNDTYYEVECWDDPGPSLYEMKLYLLDGVRSLLRVRSRSNHGT